MTLKPNLFVLIMALLLSFPLNLAKESEVAAFGDDIVRLHIIANSDDDADQALKIKVRDAILKASKEEMKNPKVFAAKAEKYFLEIAEKTLSENGYDGKVSAKTGIFDFPAKSYGNCYFPKGRYNALKIVIGEGKGQNWWCVLYPPMCFVNDEEGELLKKEDEDIIIKPEYKFKIVEFFK